MVLGQLGGSIAGALLQMSNAAIVDEKANVKRIVNLDDLAAGHNKRRIIQQEYRTGIKCNDHYLVERVLQIVTTQS